MINKNKLAFTLVEITVALGIFALLAIPAYMLFSYSASSENEYHKTAAALRVIETYRDEIKNLSFNVAKEYKSDLTPQASEIFATEHDKYGLEKEITPEERDNMIKITITIKWKNRRGTELKETQTFVKVK